MQVASATHEPLLARLREMGRGARWGIHGACPVPIERFRRASRNAPCKGGGTVMAFIIRRVSHSHDRLKARCGVLRIGEPIRLISPITPEGALRKGIRRWQTTRKFVRRQPWLIRAGLRSSLATRRPTDSLSMPSPAPACTVAQAVRRAGPGRSTCCSTPLRPRLRRRAFVRADDAHRREARWRRNKWP